MPINKFELMLTGGHPNSLGRTEEVVSIVLKDYEKMADLYDCYESTDAVVRLRVSSAMKRVCKAKPEWMLRYVDKLQTEIANLDQPSAKWSLAQIFLWLDDKLSPIQRERAIKIMQHNLKTDKDWIVQNITADALAHFAQKDTVLKNWLRPQLEDMKTSKHKSVARKAGKLLQALGE